MSSELHKELLQSILISVSIAVAFCVFVVFNYFITAQSKQAEENRKQQVLEEAEELLKKD